MNELQTEIARVKEPALLQIINGTFTNDADFEAALVSLEKTRFCLRQARKRALPPGYDKDELLYRLSELSALLQGVRQVVTAH